MPPKTLCFYSVVGIYFYSLATPATQLVYFKVSYLSQFYLSIQCINRHACMLLLFLSYSIFFVVLSDTLVLCRSLWFKNLVDWLTWLSGHKKIKCLERLE